MLTAILGRKLGMTQMFDEKGNYLPITVLEAGPCQITQIKTAEHDGYAAVQIGFKDKVKNVRMPEAGHFKKANVSPKRHLREVRVPSPEGYTLGTTVTCEIFQSGQRVDVIGTSKGRGFAGTIKLHHFTRGPEAHGSMNVRQPGSIGSNTDPGRVWKGKRMASHMGHERNTQRNLLVVKVDTAKNVILVRSAVAGPNGGLVQIRKAIYSK